MSQRRNANIIGFALLASLQCIGVRAYTAIAASLSLLLKSSSVADDCRGSKLPGSRETDGKRETSLSKINQVKMFPSSGQKASKVASSITPLFSPPLISLTQGLVIKCISTSHLNPHFGASLLSPGSHPSCNKAIPLFNPSMFHDKIVVDRKLLLETIPEGESALMTASSMKPATRDGGKLLKSACALCSCLRCFCTTFPSLSGPCMRKQRIGTWILFDPCAHRDGKVVLEGGGKGSRAHIITPDIEWNSNIVHVIDAGKCEQISLA
eukprot:1151639-Pelagomonas_calceolata.AAC.5